MLEVKRHKVHQRSPYGDFFLHYVSQEGRFIWRLWGSNEVTDVCTTCHSCCSSILVNLRPGSVTQAEKDCGLDEVNLERAAGPELIL